VYSKEVGFAQLCAARNGNGRSGKCKNGKIPQTFQEFDFLPSHFLHPAQYKKHYRVGEAELFSIPKLSTSGWLDVSASRVIRPQSTVGDVSTYIALTMETGQLLC
jgi:hypothetical protein